MNAPRYETYNFLNSSKRGAYMGSRFSGAAIAAGVIICIALCIPVTLDAQQPDSPQVGQGGQQQQEPLPKDIQDRMANERRKSRYDSLKRDSEKLLELATELKQYVDKSGENVMSLEVIKKCDEIEKLSKSVRTKMKGD